VVWSYRGGRGNDYRERAVFLCEDPFTALEGYEDCPTSLIQPTQKAARLISPLGNEY